MTILNIIHRTVCYLNVSNTGERERDRERERESNLLYWAQLKRFHLKTETECSLQNVIF
jgi:hypothetical protein